MLRAGSEYLYMVFPGGMGLYENMLQKAVKNGEFEMVRKFVVFFNSNSYVNSRDPNTGSDRLSMYTLFEKIEKKLMKKLRESLGIV